MEILYNINTKLKKITFVFYVYFFRLWPSLVNFNVESPRKNNLVSSSDNIILNKCLGRGAKNDVLLI
jgi:hypothetical protein